MGGIMPHVERKKKKQKKQQTPVAFLYANMVRIIPIQNIQESYKFMSKIGQGSSGVVYKAVSHRTNNIRAIKCISKTKQPTVTSTLEMEFAILKTLDHPNIVKMYEILESPTDLYIVTQLCEGVELFDLLMKVKKFSEKIACEIMFQSLSALKHMHQHNFMHRDIKPENIIFSEQTKTVKLIDLSSATYFDSSEPVKRKRIGTSYYIAPEVLERVYNEKCDVWSLGIILYVLLSGEPPFGGKQDIDILKNVLYGTLQFVKPIWRGITGAAKKLIKRMIERDPTKRISMAQAMQDEWFKPYLKNRQKQIVETNYIINALLNMKKFKQIKSANIQNGVLVFIVNFVNQNQHESQLIQSFKALDTNGDGVLSKEEMELGIQKYLKVSTKEARIMTERIFDRVDTNRSGLIDYSQFLIASSNIEVIINPENIDLAFECFDENKDGKLSVKQFQQKLGKNVTQERYTQLLNEFDINNDGYISKVEFRQMMEALLEDRE